MNRKPHLCILTVLFLFTAASLFSSGQTIEYNYFYRVYFTDKGNYSPELFDPCNLLSQRAIARRLKHRISFPDYYDLPVFDEYLKQISSSGLTLHCTSRWMNTGLFKSINPVNTSLIENLPFVSKVLTVKHPGVKTTKPDKLELVIDDRDALPYDNPVSMLNGEVVQSSGFNGKGVLIAVLDGGFYKANTISSLAALRARKGIKGTYDFVRKSPEVYSYHNHGTAVLSVLAGDILGYLRGSAPDANYWLFRTEDVSSEFPVEEDFWVAAAEFADSIGVDIISSSLGYFTFDDPEMDYKYEDMNGMSAFVTKAADIAFSKGILVVSSAGNERDNPWKHIIAPSDGFNVLCIGAVDGYNVISSFSSAGPSADGRIKPDNVAQGVAVTVQVNDTGVVRASGTSFSCPVLSGMCACIIQAVPDAKPTDIINALHQCSDKYFNPDSLYGYGLPDIKAVIDTLQSFIVLKPGIIIAAGPNPFTDYIEFRFAEEPGYINVEIFTISGLTVYKRNYARYISRTFRINEQEIPGHGVYFARITIAKGSSVFKIIKLNK